MNVLDYSFSDLYIDTNGDVYITDERVNSGLVKIEADDIEYFKSHLIVFKGNEKSSSFFYQNVYFRVEEINSVGGVVYSLRRMPKSVPNIHKLGFDSKFIDYILSLSLNSGLIVWAGATGSGKTTSISALLSEYMRLEGGFAYTIEEPAEMPLEGEYKTLNGSIGICKQVEVINDDWATPLKSALRSRPRYILIGEIRTAEAASECLRAAISGHLVLTTIHASTIEDALMSITKYASDCMSEDAAYDVLSRGLLGVVKQDLVKVNGILQPQITSLFANPDINKPGQVRTIIKSKNLNLGTALEQQAARLAQGKNLF